MKKSIRLQYNAPVVLTFVLLSLAVQLAGVLTKGWTTAAFFSVYRFPLTDVLGYARLFLHVLGHANLQHCMGNLTLLLVLGPMLEEKYGSRTLLLAILSTALVTGIVHCILSSGALLGASGIVFMMILMASAGSIQAGAIPLTLVFAAVVYLGGEAAAGLAARDSISQLTHILGGVCGIGWAWALKK